MYNWVYQLNIYQSYKARYKHLKMSSGIYCARLVIIFYFFETYEANSGWSNWCWSCSTEHFRNPTFRAQLHFAVSRRLKGKSTCFWNWPVEQLIDICSLVNVKYGVTLRYSCQVRNSKYLISYLHWQLLQRFCPSKVED